jgi:hypothetical protein
MVVSPARVIKKKPFDGGAAGFRNRAWRRIRRAFCCNARPSRLAHVGRDWVNKRSPIRRFCPAQLGLGGSADTIWAHILLDKSGLLCYWVGTLQSGSVLRQPTNALALGKACASVMTGLDPAISDHARG